MSIEYRVLGAPGADNALYVQVQTGQRIHRLLFDCGEGVLAPLGFAEVQAIDHLCFSHLHMDHVGGFDSFFRATYNRASRPVNVWGPPETARIMHHRFQGFLWNLFEGDPGTCYVGDVHPNHIERWRYEASEAFATAHPADIIPFTGTVIEAGDYTVDALHMDHLTPSLAYIVRERSRLNVDAARLAELGLQPGSWLRELKEAREGEEPEVAIDGSRYQRAALRRELLTATPGDSIAYLTDFLLDETAMQRLVPALAGCQTLVCECQYADADAALAARNHHMTASQVAELARRADVGHLMLFHLSDRYRPPGWLEMLKQARSIVPRTSFPEGWSALLDHSQPR
ncbi:MAG TPA: MBL fold metallo-hydrolase [Ktedonobacterales bacterium]|jgi:ribonuclease Z|nr:MBL fold metallo-hydrolase [Ktedonobacterales bacterium]